jgi:hypothetical protein
MRQKAGVHSDPHCPMMVTHQYPKVHTTSSAPMTLLPEVCTTSTTKKQGTTVLNTIPGALKPISSHTPLWKTVTLLRD